MGQAHEQRFVKQLIAQSTGAGSHRMSQIGPVAECLELALCTILAAIDNSVRQEPAPDQSCPVSTTLQDFSGSS